jgi:endonuclease/exonuclease/phosphatase family metal-dependent hydrolase
MKRFSILAAFAALFCILCSCERRDLTVMSFNVRTSVKDDGANSWAERRTATPLMLRKVKPDIFGVQEATPEQEAYIAETCPVYAAFGVGRDDGALKGERATVFYNKRVLEMEEGGTWWLSETPDVPSVGWDAKYPRTATWALMKDRRCGRKFYFVNTHLDHKGAAARRNGLAMIVEKTRGMNPDIPLVLVGDFNVEPGDSCLVDVDRVLLSARSSALVTEQTPSFNGFQPEPFKTIDYIYYGGFASAEKFSVITEPFDGKPFISDHYPIVATLRFRP